MRLISFALVLVLAGFGEAFAEPEVGMKEGQRYPDFVLPDLAGKLRRLSDFRGKKRLIFNFASW